MVALLFFEGRARREWFLTVLQVNRGVGRGSRKVLREGIEGGEEEQGASPGMEEGGCGGEATARVSEVG